MLRITIDMFSGRENPVYDVTDDAEARALVRAVSDKRAAVADGEPADGGLGLRGFDVEILDDELAGDWGLGAAGYVASAPGAADGAGMELSKRIAALLRANAQLVTDGLEGESVLDFIDAQLKETVDRGVTVNDPEAVADEEDLGAQDVTCRIELYRFNPGFWNNDANTRRRNNCYNYASNWRTNTFAQPGRGTGSIYTAITCPEVSRAALHDGMHRRYDCFPDSEKPRFLVALVVAPGPGFVDYHWYRKQKEGFWGHKPGPTNARNTDNSNRVIMDPRTCNRGPYTQFCGFFYGCNSQRRRIR